MLKVLTGQGAQIDTTTPAGRMIFGIFATLAEFERDLLLERTRSGIQRAKTEGKHMGRPNSLSQKQRAEVCEALGRGESVSARAEEWDAMTGARVMMRVR